MWLITKEHTAGALAGLTTVEQTSVEFHVGDVVDPSLSGGAYTVVNVVHVSDATVLDDWTTTKAIQHLRSVLGYFDGGAMQPGSFVHHLIEAMLAADPQNLAALGRSFPAYAQAVQLYRQDPERLDLLSGVRGGGKPDPATDGGLLDLILAAGIRWLTDTVQPDDAILGHHGESSRDQESNRSYRFIPVAANGHPALVVGVLEPRFFRGQLTNPIRVGEMESVMAALENRGVKVTTKWNGAGLDSGSLSLDLRIHPSLMAVQRRYSRGCPRHDTVFCGRDGCDWLRTGIANAVRLVDVIQS